MELNITKFFNEAAPMDYSASRAEIGQEAAADTWRAACDDSEDYMILDTEDKREAFRDFIKGFGAWEDTEIATWSAVELNALCLQFIAGDMREGGLDSNATPEDWRAYADNQSIASRLFLAADGQIYFYIGD